MSYQLYTVFSCLLIGYGNGQFSEFYTSFNGSYYLFSRYPKSFPHALRTCGSINGIIAPARTPEEGAFLRRFSRKFVGGRIWIGGTDVNRKDGDYIWLDGSPLVYKNWSPGEPLNAGGKENCMVMEPGKSALWNDVDCNLFRHPFFCTVKIDPSQWTFLRPFFEYRYFNTSRNYVDAEKVCVSYGGTLVPVNRTGIHLSFLTSLRSVFYQVSVGLNSVPSVWLQTNIQNGIQTSCFLVFGNKTVGKDLCKNKHNFICMRPSVPSSTIETTMATTTEVINDSTTSSDDSSTKISEVGEEINDRFDVGFGIGAAIGAVSMAGLCSLIFFLFLRSRRKEKKITVESSSRHIQLQNNTALEPIDGGHTSNYDRLQQNIPGTSPEYEALKLYENVKSY